MHPSLRGTRFWPVALCLLLAHLSHGAVGEQGTTGTDEGQLRALGDSTVLFLVASSDGKSGDAPATTLRDTAPVPRWRGGSAPPQERGTLPDRLRVASYPVNSQAPPSLA